MNKISSLFLLLTSLHLAPFILFSQNGNLKYEDFKNYYIFNNSLMDVRTHTKVVSNKIFSSFNPVYNKIKKTLSLWDGNILTIDDKGKFLNTIPVGYSSFSPDWNTILYVKEGDIWTSKVDYNNGKFYNDKRLTQLGIFPNTIDVVNWFGNNVILYAQNKIYQINCENGVLTEAPFSTAEIAIAGQNRWYRNFYLGDKNTYYNRISPKRRYCLITKKDRLSFVFDMKHFTKKAINQIDLSPTSFPSWPSDSIALVFTGDWQKHSLYKVNCQSGEIVNLLFNIPEYFDDARCNNESNHFRESVSKNISVKGSYIFIPLKKTINKSNYLIFNLKNGQEIINPEVIFPQRALNYEWISDDTFLYIQEGDITNQGTWVYNVKKREHKRITPFILQQVVVLPHVDKVLFVANNYLFQLSIKEYNLDQISKEQLQSVNLVEFNPEIIYSGSVNNISPVSTIQGNITSPQVVKPISNTFGYVKTLQGSNLRLRSEPSDKSLILTQIPNGAKVKILAEDDKIVIVNGEKGKWFKIEYEGTNGWAWGKFIVL